MKKKKKRNRNKKNPETKIIDINLHRFNGDVETLRIEVPAGEYEEYMKNLLKESKNNPHWLPVNIQTDLI